MAGFPRGSNGGGDLINLVTEFGVDNTGTVTDNSTALNNAIATLAAKGLGGFIPANGSHPPIVNIANPILLGNGNGTSSSPSSYNGPLLVGAGFPTAPNFAGIAPAGFTIIRWTGASGGPEMIYVGGEVTGWGLQNLYLQGEGNANIGVKVEGGLYGTVDGLSIENCPVYGIDCNLNALSNPSGALKNRWNNIYVSVPNVSGATGIAIGTGTFNAGANTSYDKWDGVTLVAASGNPTNQCVGVELANCDSVVMEHVNIGGYGGKWTQLSVNYTPSSGAWPASCSLVDWDFGAPSGVTGNGQFAFSGSPSGANSGKNHIVLPNSANGSLLTVIANVGYTFGSVGFDLFMPGQPFGTTTLSAPAVPANNSPWKNTWGVPVRVYINGTVTAIAINGVAITGLAISSSTTMVVLMPYDTITLSYSSAPTWQWVGM